MEITDLAGLAKMKMNIMCSFLKSEMEDGTYIIECFDMTPGTSYCLHLPLCKTLSSILYFSSVDFPLLLNENKQKGCLHRQEPPVRLENMQNFICSSINWHHGI